MFFFWRVLFNDHLYVTVYFGVGYMSPLFLTCLCVCMCLLFLLMGFLDLKLSNITFLGPKTNGHHQTILDYFKTDYSLK